LQEEIEMVDRGDTPINDSARSRIASAVRMRFFGRIKSRMVTFALSNLNTNQTARKRTYTNDDGQGWLIRLLRSIEFPKGGLDERKLFLDHSQKLALRKSNSIQQHPTKKRREITKPPKHHRDTPAHEWAASYS
jgi:hypothetical protein